MSFVLANLFPGPASLNRTGIVASHSSSSGPLAKLKSQVSMHATKPCSDYLNILLRDLKDPLQLAKSNVSESEVNEFASNLDEAQGELVELMLADMRAEQLDPTRVHSWTREVRLNSPTDYELEFVYKPSDTFVNEFGETMPSEYSFQIKLQTKGDEPRLMSRLKTFVGVDPCSNGRSERYAHAIEHYRDIGDETPIGLDLVFIPDAEEPRIHLLDNALLQQQSPALLASSSQFHEIYNIPQGLKACDSFDVTADDRTIDFGWLDPQ